MSCFPSRRQPRHRLSRPCRLTPLSETFGRGLNFEKLPVLVRSDESAVESERETVCFAWV
jgi:hypothetical protein